MEGEGPRFAVLSREMGPLQPPREQGGGDGALGSNAGRPPSLGPGALCLRTLRGRAGT